MALAVVLGLILLLGLVVGLVFNVALEDGRMVAKGWKECRSRMLGESGLSWTLAHLGIEPSMLGNHVARIWLDPENAGFDVSIRPHGLFLGVKVKALGEECDSTLFGWSEIARVYQGAPAPILLLRKESDYRVLQGGRFDGGYFLSHGLLQAEGMAIRDVAGRRIDSNRVDALLWSTTGLEAAKTWDSLAQVALAGGEPLDNDWVQARVQGNHRLSGLVADRTELHVSGTLELESVRCRQCILLADRIESRGIGNLDGSVAWARKTMHLQDVLEGNGQMLSGDSLVLERLHGRGTHMVYASLGRGAATSDSLSSSFVRVVQSHGKGWIFATGLSGGSHDLRTRMSVDSLSSWDGGWCIHGALENSGSLRGILLGEGIRWRAPNGAIWDGRTPGRIQEMPDSVRWCLPWSMADSAKDIGLRWWGHERK